MSSRTDILNKLKQSASNELMALNSPSQDFDTAYLGNELDSFKETLESLYTDVYEYDNMGEIHQFLSKKYAGERVIKHLPNDSSIKSEKWNDLDPHQLQDVEFTLIEGSLGVAENGAIWVSEEQMGQRIAPFICQRLGIVLNKSDIVATMHQAYEKLEISDSGFGVFISGPSKTADIEQSLVRGAHGARELYVFII